MRSTICPHTHLFKHEERLRRTDEDLGLAVNHVLFKVLLLNQNADSVAVGSAAKVRPRVLRHHFVSPQETIVTLSIGETRSTDTDILDQTQIIDLVADSFLVEENGRFLVVGFDTADVVRLFRSQILHQSNHRVLEQRSGRQRPLRCLLDRQTKSNE